MYPFEDNYLKIEELFDALIIAHQDYRGNKITPLPLSLVTEAQKALTQLIVYVLNKHRTSFYIEALLKHNPPLGQDDLVQEQKIRLIDLYMKGTDVAADERSDRALLDFQKRSNQTAILWAYYYYAVARKNGGNACKNWLCAMLSTDGMSDYYQYGDSATFKNLVGVMTKKVTAKHSPDSSFARRYDALLLCLELELNVGIDLINQVEAIKKPQ